MSGISLSPGETGILDKTPGLQGLIIAVRQKKKLVAGFLCDKYEIREDNSRIL